MTVIDESTVIFNSVYITKAGLAEEPIFGYIRFLKDGELGFSVLDEPVSRPDYSNCGLFWVKPEDFLKMFRPLHPEDLARYESYASSERSFAEDEEYGNCEGLRGRSGRRGGYLS